MFLGSIWHANRTEWIKLFYSIFLGSTLLMELKYIISLVLGPILLYFLNTPNIEWNTFH